MAISRGIWDPNPRVTNIKGTHFKSLTLHPLFWHSGFSSSRYRVHGLDAKKRPIGTNLIQVYADSWALYEL